MAGVTLRPLRRGDFATLARWLREPVVAEWWHEDATGDALERRYGPSLDGADPTELRIALADGEPAGLIQWYRYSDEPEYLAEVRAWVPVGPAAWSLDYLVGGAAFRGRGIGTAMIAGALREIGPAEVVVPVHERNAASAAVLRRAGFVRAGSADLEPDNPAHSRRHAVYRRAGSSSAAATSA